MVTKLDTLFGRIFHIMHIILYGSIIIYLVILQIIGNNGMLQQRSLNILLSFV